MESSGPSSGQLLTLREPARPSRDVPRHRVAHRVALGGPCTLWAAYGRGLGILTAGFAVRPDGLPSAGAEAEHVTPKSCPESLPDTAGNSETTAPLPTQAEGAAASQPAGREGLVLDVNSAKRGGSG